MTRNPLIYAGTLLLLVLTIASAIVANAVADVLHAWEQAPQLMADRITALQSSVDALPAKVLPPVLAEVRRQGDGVRGGALGAVANLATTADARLQSIQDQVDRTSKKTLEVADGIRADLKPVLTNAATLTANYALLPDRLAAELQPSWLAIQPEITCRQSDGSGYGGCWHSRITGLMGEALKVGGVFTQKFPVMVDNFNGIGHNVEQITAGIDQRFFHPPPQTTKQKIAAGFKDVVFAGSGLARLVR